MFKRTMRDAHYGFQFLKMVKLIYLLFPHNHADSSDFIKYIVATEWSLMLFLYAPHLQSGQLKCEDLLFLDAGLDAISFILHAVQFIPDSQSILRAYYIGYQ